MISYNEFDLLEDIKEVLISDDNYRIKIACIESYFDVYERLVHKSSIVDKESNP